MGSMLRCTSYAASLARPCWDEPDLGLCATYSRFTPAIGSLGAKVLLLAVLRSQAFIPKTTQFSSSPLRSERPRQSKSADDRPPFVPGYRLQPAADAMAKVKREDARAMPKAGRCPTDAQKKRQAADWRDSDPFSLVQDTDYVSPKRARQRPAEEDEAPLKSSIGYNPSGATGYTLKVNGKETPIYKCAISGFEHLFTTELQQAQPTADLQPKRTPGIRPPDLRNSQLPRPREKKTSATPRGVKRSRVLPRADDGDDEDDQPVSRRSRPKTLYINDIDALKAFYHTRLKELTMKPLRQIATAWVRELSPKRQTNYGRYHGFTPATAPEGEKSAPWWPRDIPYLEPAHLKLQYLIPLTIDIMLVHRKIDAEHGKRGKAWIKTLRKRAINSVDDTSNDNFSSSADPTFNRAMKERALTKILPSLFDIAEAHEDYVVQYELFEGSGNEDPGEGKEVSWEPVPRPDRSLRKKARLAPSATPAHQPELTHDSEASGDETEADESMANSTFSSFQSWSNEEDAKSTRAPSPDPAHYRTPRTTSTIPHAAFSQNMSRLRLSDGSDAKSTVDDDEAVQYFGMKYRPTGAFQPVDMMPFPNPASYHPDLGGSMFPQPQQLQPHPIQPFPSAVYPAYITASFLSSYAGSDSFTA
ncbi:hypothetical protein CC80DRAFT_560571 [Byssothecium circinans]|uniref:Subtelomeric hrmA-associated cluster protein AFUB-079030/YDR124W-like helical bundle domain-containing protein n=1 Tax=Byssothecium circinans TaxID=147558 RepID=A0A6A5U8C5_9PLEO|nr:hypothetical protein CC80DRAFT_560571 [Byssothecium circinans]